MKSELMEEMSPRLVRECVLQALYQLEFHPDNIELVIQERGEKLTGSFHQFYLRMIEGIKEHQSQINDLIKRYLKSGWSVDRISVVDRAILQIAIYELLYEVRTPKGVVINEAVDLAKIYSGVESSRFVNGVLGNIVKDIGERLSDKTE
ncbi:transcription antitermination factor NusB [Thermoflavimicrobium daqui]|uniref:Transcription antitermination protein NusB n=1 Tax=Thermoflavimicrobium daqui TaxID=2137476 RepID=A0A364K8F6_9BACL|nr:transcription antitermination factor NusB [Thermoflavimicrobium daqui]RAL26558.1 transcription antitermination factor NusB [Thermoflavimicrobium daqui]